MAGDWPRPARVRRYRSARTLSAAGRARGVLSFAIERDHEGASRASGCAAMILIEAPDPGGLGGGTLPSEYVLGDTDTLEKEEWSWPKSGGWG